MSTPVDLIVPGLPRRLLAMGVCGQVLETVLNDGRPVAVKVLDPEVIDRISVIRHLRKLRAMPPHPNLVPVLGWASDEATGAVEYVMPLYADAGPDGVGLVPRSLEARCGRTAPAVAWRWLADVAEGLAELHRRSMIHGNLRPANVFLNGDGDAARAVVADGGHIWAGGRPPGAPGDRLAYAPPEGVGSPDGDGFDTGARRDVYAFGVMACHLLTGAFPLGQDRAPGGAAPNWPAPPTDGIESLRRTIINRCLLPEPAERWAEMSEVRDALAAIARPAAAAPVGTEEAGPGQKDAVAARSAAGHSAAQPPPAGTAISAPGTRRAFAPGRQAAPWIGWGAAAAAMAAAILGVLYLLEHTALQGARAVIARQQSDLDRLSSEHTKERQQRDQALAEARAALADAVAATARAETTLAGSQVLAEQFFGSLLEAAAQLPATGERDRLLLDGYEHFSRFLTTHGDRPEFAETLLHTRCHLAAAKRALGSPDEAADRFDDARVRITAFLAAHPDHPRAAALRLRAADCLLQTAQIRLKSGSPTPDVTANLASALAEVTAAAETAGQPPELMRRVAEGEIILAQAASTRAEADGAGTAARVQHAIDLLHQLLSDPRHAQPADTMRLGHALLLRGRLERRRGAIELALATQVETAQVLLECGDQPEALERLAQCYAETGAMLEANGEALDALRAHGEAVKILSDLAREAPERVDHRMALAARYADLATLLRTQGQAPRALEYQRGAVDLVQALLARDAGNVTMASTLAGLRANLADLMADLGQPTEAATEAREAVVLLDRLSPAVPDAAAAAAAAAAAPDRAAIARSYAVAGTVAAKADQPDQARNCFQKAVAHYEAAAAASPGNPEIDRGLAECRTHLARLSR